MGSGITAPGSGITSHEIRISHFLRAQLKDQTVPFLWDQGSKFVTLFESGIRNLGTEMGSAMKKKTYLVTTLCSPLHCCAPTVHVYSSVQHSVGFEPKDSYNIYIGGPVVPVPSLHGICRTVRVREGGGEGGGWICA